jgi:hypothetical protein
MKPSRGGGRVAWRKWVRLRLTGTGIRRKPIAHRVFTQLRMVHRVAVDYALAHQMNVRAPWR